jgi:MFS family permease
VIAGVHAALAHLRASRRVIAAVGRNPALRRVELGYLLFNSVEFGTWVAVLLYAYQATGPASIGLVAVAQLIPAAVTAPFASLAADRSDRLRALAGGYLVQAIAFGVTAAGMLLGASAILVYITAAAATSTLSVTRPTVGALLPQLARTPEELSAANGLSGTVEGGGVLLGPLAAALLLTVGPPGLVFAVGTAAFLFAALLTLSIGADARRGVLAARALGYAAGPEAVDGDPGSPAGRILDGLRAVWRDPHVRLVVGLLGLRSMVSGTMDVLFVLVALEILKTGDPGAAILNAALGVGMVIGGAVSFLLVGRRRLAPAMAVAASVLGVALLATGALGTSLTAPILVGLGGLGFAACDVAGRTILQRTTADQVLGRVLGTLESVNLFGLALGSLIAPIVATAVGVGGALAVAGLLMPLGILLAWRSLRDIDRRTRVPARELALLRRSPVFAPLAPPELETLARHTRWRAVDPGTAVIVEGAAGDAYYVIEHGRFRVDQGGVELRTLDRPVDGFGEIALIRNTPRTATVTAEAPSVLLVVGRVDFLAAVTGSQPSRSVIDEIVRDRA